MTTFVIDEIKVNGKIAELVSQNVRDMKVERSLLQVAPFTAKVDIDAAKAHELQVTLHLRPQ